MPHPKEKYSDFNNQYSNDVFNRLEPLQMQ